MWDLFRKNAPGRRDGPVKGGEGAADASSAPATASAHDAGTQGLALLSGLGRAATAGLRRPLLDGKGALAGFEHAVPGRVDAGQSTDVRAVTPMAAEDAAWLLGSMATSVAAGRRALAVMPSAALEIPEVRQQASAGMMLALSDAPFGDPARQDLLADLRRRGAVLGTPGVPRAGASFVVFDATGLDRQALLNRAEACRIAAPGSGVMATGIGSLDDLEAALHGGFQMAAGLFDSATLRPEGATMTPEVSRIVRLLQLVMENADTSVLARAIRGDVSLTYRLLRQANSPLLGLRRTIESVEQAVQMLGRQTLYRMLTVLLVVGCDGRPTSLALQEIALARARMMEQLAPAVGGPREALFTTGLLSLVDVMMQMPMAQALAPLSLPDPARTALIDGSGPWRVLIDLARSLETGQMALAEELAKPLGGLDAVQATMLEAWGWAAELIRTIKTEGA